MQRVVAPRLQLWLPSASSGIPFGLPYKTLPQHTIGSSASKTTSRSFELRGVAGGNTAGPRSNHVISKMEANENKGTAHKVFLKTIWTRMKHACEATKVSYKARMKENPPRTNISNSDLLQLISEAEVDIKSFKLLDLLKRQVSSSRDERSMTFYGIVLHWMDCRLGYQSILGYAKKKAESERTTVPETL